MSRKNRARGASGAKSPLSERTYSIADIAYLARLLGFHAEAESTKGVAFIRFNEPGVLPDVVVIISTDKELRLPESEVVSLFEDAGNSRDLILREIVQLEGAG